jgi:hypothetical protein
MPITKASSNAVAAAAKGDLVVGNATNDSGVLAVGSTDQVLTVDSSTATGLKWAAVAGGGYTSLASGSLSGSSVTLSSISGAYRDLVLVLENVLQSGDSLGMRVNGSSSNGYRAVFMKTDATTLTNFGTNTYFDLGLASSSTNYIRTVITIPNYASTTGAKSIQFNGAWPSNVAQWGVGLTPNISTSAIDSITLLGSTGSFTGGTYTLYGVK